MSNVEKFPAGLAVPPFVIDRLAKFDAHEADQDSVALSNPGWWAGQEGLVPCGTMPSKQRASLTRGDLFDLGRVAASSKATDDDILTLLWHVLEWGTGKNERGNRRRVAAFIDEDDRQHNVQLLRTATAAACKGDPRSAYGTLIKRGGGKIAGLGPAYFTKFLYFVSDGLEQGIRCLILDARVARSLHRVGWPMPNSRSGFSYNWYTDTYVRYCELLDSWAQEQTRSLGRKVFPGEIEKILFDGSERSPLERPDVVDPAIELANGDQDSSTSAS